MHLTSAAQVLQNVNQYLWRSCDVSGGLDLVTLCWNKAAQHIGELQKTATKSCKYTLTLYNPFVMAVAAIIQGYITLLRTHWGTTLIFLLVARSLYRRYCTPLRHVPGPFLASITTLWLLSVQYSPRQHHIYVELHQKYGPVVRISPYRVIFACPDSINEYFGWNKSKWWKALWPNPTVKNHGGVLEVTAHKAAKAKVMGAYNMSYLIKSEGKVDGHIIAFMDKLAGKLGQPFDFAPYGQFFGK